MMRLLALFGMQAIAYLVLVVNIRAVGQTRYLAAGASEMVYALLNFVLIHRIVEARTASEASAYAAGCTVGTLAAMWITKHWRHDAQPSGQA